MYNVLIFFLFFSNQLNSGYHATGSSGGLPGGQITLSIQKVVVHKLLPKTIISFCSFTKVSLKYLSNKYFSTLSLSL